MKKQTKTMTDHRGFEIPVDVISKQVRIKDLKARRLLAKAKLLSARLAKFKKDYFETMEELYRADAEKRGVIGKGKGGYSITSFDKEIKLEINISSIISFTEEIQFAQELIHDALKEMTGESANGDLSAVANHAFSVKKGKLDKSRLIGLFTIGVKNEKWKRAMDIIKESMTIDETRKYPQIYEKNANGEYKAVQLNLSSI